MTRKTTPPTLQVLGMEEVCKLTLGALNNILEQEGKVCPKNISCCSGKRKRSDSCSDYPVKKKPRKDHSAHYKHDCNTEMKDKRRRDDEGYEGDRAEGKRRRGTEIQCEEGAFNLSVLKSMQDEEEQECINKEKRRIEEERDDMDNAQSKKGKENDREERTFSPPSNLFLSTQKADDDEVHGKGEKANDKPYQENSSTFKLFPSIQKHEYNDDASSKRKRLKESDSSSQEYSFPSPSFLSSRTAEENEDNGSQRKRQKGIELKGSGKPFQKHSSPSLISFLSTQKHEDGEDDSKIQKENYISDQEQPSTSSTSSLSNEKAEDNEVYLKKRKGNYSPCQEHSYIPIFNQKANITLDDSTNCMRSTSSEKLENLRFYFCDVTPSMWTTLGRSLIKKVVRKIRFETVDTKILTKTLEYVLCEKLLSFSTEVIERYLKGLERMVFCRLRTCKKLEVLEVTVTPLGNMSVKAASLAMQGFQYLHSLALLPNSRYSYHWAVRPLSNHCHALKELRIVYNGDLFSCSDELRGLKKCTRLVSLWLFNFGRNSEMLEVTHLMESLHNLRMLFHKELPNAILDLQRTRDTEGEIQDLVVTDRTLRLERVDLCWHHRSIGYQLVYVPSSHLLQMAKLCPQLMVLNLVGPPCLAQVIESLPHLQVLILQQASLSLTLGCALNNSGLERVTELRLTDMCDVTHDMISALASECPNLRVLNIINSALKAQGDLKPLTPRSPFPSLRQVTLVPFMIHNRPSLTTPSKWQLGARLTTYILTGASHLTHLHLSYKPEDVPDTDLPTAQHLHNLLTSPRHDLRALHLEWPPAVSPGLVGALVHACPSLVTLSSIITWPISSNQRSAIVTQYGPYIDIT